MVLQLVTSSDSAADKALAINNANAGVKAEAKTVVRVSVDLVTPSDGTDMSDAADASINGITTNLKNVTDIDGLVTTINSALEGKVDIVATTNTDGELVLTSESGLNIEVLGGLKMIYSTLLNQKGVAFTVSNSDFTFSVH